MEKNIKVIEKVSTPNQKPLENPLAESTYINHPCDEALVCEYSDYCHNGRCCISRVSEK